MRTYPFGFALALCLSSAGCMHPRTIVLSPTSPEGLRVNGLGKASAPPDLARANLGVEVRAATPEQASADASQRMAAVLAALKQAGIAERDLRSHGYSVAFEQTPAPPQPAAAGAAAPEAGGPRGVYRVTNMLELTIRDLASIGRLLKLALDAGANNLWGVNFELEDDSALVTRARALAVAEAKRAAEELAQLSGVKLGEVVSISEGEPSSVEPSGYAMRASSLPEVPIERGQITVNYLVQLVYTTTRE